MMIHLCDDSTLNVTFADEIKCPAGMAYECHKAATCSWKYCHWRVHG